MGGKWKGKKGEEKQEMTFIYDYSGLEEGMNLQAEYDGVYYSAKVVAVSTVPRRAKAPVKVSFVGYTEADDIWLSGDSLRSKAITKTPKDSKAGSKYKKVQCVAYEISTRPGGWDTATTADDIYKGIWAEGEGACWADCAARVKILAEALQSAKSSPNIDKSPGTLKVFMAPEFLLRGPRGAFKMETLLGTKSNPEKGLGYKLSELIKGPEWKDWLVVFGTIIGYAEDQADGKTEVYNCAYVQKGGWTTEKQRRSGCVSVMKAALSGIDFLKNPADALAGALAHSEVAHVEKLSETAFKKCEAVLKNHTTLDFDGVFEIDGVTFGIDICLDHAMKRLKLTSPKIGNCLMQVQLVPSCGMSIQYDSVAVQKGGVIFSCDGLNGFRNGLKAACTSAVYSEPLTLIEKMMKTEKFYSASAMLNSGWSADSIKRHLDMFDQEKKALLKEEEALSRVLANGEDWKTKLDQLWDIDLEVGPHIAVYPAMKLPPAVRLVKLSGHQ